MPDDDRARLRAAIRNQRRALSVARQRDAASAVAQNVIALGEYHTAQFIGAYLAFDAELAITAVIGDAWARKKSVYVPVLQQQRGLMQFAKLREHAPTAPNRYGIDEPLPDACEYLPAERLDLVLVPLVAADPDGNRIGMGAGCYDRCFAFLRSGQTGAGPGLIGIAYDFQLQEAIEIRDWDVSLSAIVTETRVIRCRRRITS